MLRRRRYDGTDANAEFHGPAVQDPDHLDDYVTRSAYLAALNNELEPKDDLLRDNLMTLDRMVLFRFADDFTVVPKDSAWFGAYYGKQWQDLRDTELYKVRRAYLAAKCRPAWASFVGGNACMEHSQIFCYKCSFANCTDTCRHMA